MRRHSRRKPNLLMGPCKARTMIWSMRNRTARSQRLHVFSQALWAGVPVGGVPSVTEGVTGGEGMQFDRGLSQV